MRRPRALTALVSSVVLALVVAGPVSANCKFKSEYVKVRQATKQFHSVATAEAAGYEKFLPCFDEPGVGGMGQHFADMNALDGTLDPLHPEVLVYEPHKDKYKLVAVEYVVPQAAWSGSAPPSLFGEDFHRNDTLGIWALHAWIWRGNPLGINADYNPNVRLCPKPAN